MARFLPPLQISAEWRPYDRHRAVETAGTKARSPPERTEQLCVRADSIAGRRLFQERGPSVRRRLTVLPDGGEILALQDFAGLDLDPVLDQVAAGGDVAGVARHVVDGDRRAGAVGAVGRAAVPGEAVVEHHLALLHLARDDLDGFARRDQAEIGGG